MVVMVVMMLNCILIILFRVHPTNHYDYTRRTDGISKPSYSIFFLILETWNEFIENHYKVKLNFKLDREDTFLLTKNDLLSIFPSFGII